MNRIENPSFEDGYAVEDKHRVHMFKPVRNDAGEIVRIEAHDPYPRAENPRPAGWETWFYADEQAPPWDPDNAHGFVPPETRLAPHEGRPHTGQSGMLAFGFHKIFRGGWYQRVKGLTVGDVVEADFWAHWWCSSGDDPRQSVGVGSGPYFALEGETEHDSGYARVGIDPTGGTDLFADTVIWGQGAHSYNAHHRHPALQVIAQGDTVTVFVWASARWRWKHNDFYVDDVALRVVQPVIPEPAPEPPAPQPEPGAFPMLVARGSKLAAAHAIGTSHTLDHVRDVVNGGGRYVSVKYLDAGSAHEIKALDPQVITLVRFSRGAQGKIDVEGPPLDGDLRATARALIKDELLPKLDAYGREHVDILELINETNPPTIEGQLRLAELMAHSMDFLDEEGVTGGLFSYSLGCPSYAAMQAISETGIFGEMQARGHVLCLHEYDDPLWKGFGTEPIVPGGPVYPDRGVIAGRYRWWYRDFLIPRGEVVPLFITEANVARDRQYLTQAEWLEQLMWYDHILREDYYVVAAHQFTLTETQAWQKYNWAQWWPTGLLPYVLAQKDVPNAVPVVDDGQEPPSHGLPVEPYDKTYNVVEADIPLARRREIYTLAAEVQESVGPAATDALAWATELIDAGRSVTLKAWDRRPEDYDRWREFVDSVEPRVTLRFEGNVNQGGIPEPTAIIPYCQRHQPWAGMYLGESRHTVGGSGCTVTGTASLLTLVDPTMDPGKLTAWLNANGGFTKPDKSHSGGLMYMNAPFLMPGIREKMRFVRYHTDWRKAGQVADLKVVRRLLDNGPAVIQVDFYPETAPLDSHFVLALRMIGDADVEVMDPWTGQIVRLMQTYGQGRTLEQSIFTALEWEWVDEPAPAPQPESPARGVHGPPSPSAPADISGLVASLQSMGIRWYKMLDDGDGHNVELVAALKAAGIEVVVRLWRGHHLPGPVPNVENVARLIEAGVRYVEVINEPNLLVEWGGRSCSWQNPGDVAAIGATWMDAAQRVVALGGAAGLPAMAPTDRNGTHPQFSSQVWVRRLFAWLDANHGAEIRNWQQSGKLWLAVHAVTMARPLDYDPRRSWGVDDMCLRGYEPVRHLAFETFGAMPVISTEGGVFSPFHLGQLWPDCVRGGAVYAEGTDDLLYDEASWGEYIKRANAAVDIPLCHWHLRDIGNEWDGAGWFTQNGRPRPPVAALQT